MYHGLVFNTGGQCTFAPSIEPGAKLPAPWRLTSFPVKRRYGLVWTCLAQETDRDVPALFSDEDLDAGRLLFVKARTWPVSAARQMENFLDLAHLPHIHSGSLGGDPNNVVKPGQIEHTEDGLIQTRRVHRGAVRRHAPGRRLHLPGGAAVCYRFYRERSDRRRPAYLQHTQPARRQ